MQRVSVRLHTFAYATILLMVIVVIALAAWLLAHGG
jgi:hypothetical protein